MLIFRFNLDWKEFEMIIEVHPVPNGKSNGKGAHRLVGQSGFNMMTVPQSPSQIVISQDLSIGETVRVINGQRVVCVSVGNLQLSRGTGLGSSLGPNHSYTISK